MVAAMARSSSSMPSPVRAETTTAWGSLARIRAMTAGSAASALFSTMISGIRCASTSANTERTAAIWPSGSGCEPSTTCRMTSASATSSRVERNASTSCVGRFRTKPTVSERV